VQPRRFPVATALAILLAFPPTLALAGERTQTGPSSASNPVVVGFPSGDGLEITAELYSPHRSAKTPLIVLCHQAGWSRGEYREIAPRLNALGFNCLALDQRSGEGVEGVSNETAARAAAAGMGATYVDALPDIVAALRWARTEHATGPVLLWWSSYSAALALKVAGDHPELVDGVLAFSPGEYFVRFGKPEDWVGRSAATIRCPSFITSARGEHDSWRSLHAAIPTDTKASYRPVSAGNHGSRALWSRFDDNADYWAAVESFLDSWASSPPAALGSKAPEAPRR